MTLELVWVHKFRVVQLGTNGVVSMSSVVVEDMPSLRCCSWLALSHDVGSVLEFLDHLHLVWMVDDELLVVILVVVARPRNDLGLGLD